MFVWRFSFKTVFVCVISTLFAGTLRAQIRPQVPKESELAGLHPEVVWQRTSPSVKNPGGPVLYQLIFRSNATPGNIPVISNTFTLTNSPIKVGSGIVAIGGMGINSTTGVISFAAAQTFPGVGTVTGVTAGSGLNGGTINTSGTISLNTAFTDARYLQLSGGTMTGKITFAAGQTFPGAGGGSVTNVTGTAPVTVTNGSTTPNISIANGGIGNTLLSNSSLTIASGAGLSGGGLVPLGGSLTLSNTGLLNLAVNAPLLSSGGQSPTLSLGTVGVASGGTGVVTSGTAGNYLRSNGAAWTTSPITAADLPSLSGTYVDISSNQTIGGTKTFSNPVSASITGNAATATTAASATSATTATTAANALALGGTPAAAFNTTAQNDARYLQLTGGTLTGNLSATTGNFSGALSSGGLQLPATGTATSGGGFKSNAEDLIASAFNLGASAAQQQLFRWQSEPAGNNTANPSATLNLLFGANGASPGETGLVINSKGMITFAAGQTFPGTGGGSVVSVNSGAGLTGGPITTSGTLSVATGGITNVMLANPSLTVAAGSGLNGGGSVALGGTTTLGVAAGGITNAMLQNPSLTVATGSGLAGGGSVALGGSLTLTNSGLLGLTATTPLAASAGQTPNISLNTVDIAHGGTGITSSPAAAGQFLRSSGVGTWAVGSIAAGDVPSLSGTYVDLSNNQTIAGTKTFSSTISGSISGNAATATTATSATTAATATNALALGGTPAASFSTTAQSDARYLQLGGGTLTGALNGTSANFSGAGGFGGAVNAAGLQLPATGVATAGAGFNSNAASLTASSFKNGSSAQNQTFTLQSEPLGNNSGSPSASLNLLFSGTSNGFTPTETGLSIGANGLVTFAPGQAFPGAGGGSVTQVNTGAGLTGGPITGNGTISVASGGVTNTMLANPSLTVTAGSGLTGGGSVALGGTTTLGVAAGGVTNTMLANPSLTVTAGTGLSGGGAVALGGTTTLNNTGVLSVGASAPLSSSLGQNPSISLGTVGIANGGTGITTSPAAAGQFLRSSGAGTWAVGSIASGDLPSLSGTYVDLSSSQVIGGAKTFSSTISGSISGNAATATTATSATTAATATNALALGGTPAASYNTTAQNDTRYLQLSGGTLTGILNGTSASFSGNGSFTGSLTEAGGSVLPATAPATIGGGFNSNSSDLVASAFNSSGSGSAQNQTFRLQSEPANNDTVNPSATLNLLFGNTSAPSETGFSINSNGTVNFAPSQTFPGTGTITGVTAGSGLSGGGTSGSVSLAANLNHDGSLTGNGGSSALGVASGGVTNTMLANPSLTVTAGSGLTGGGSVALGSSTTLSVGSGAITNAMLASPSVTVNAGTGLTGGGSVALGNSTTISLSSPVAIANGGTGITTSPASAGQFLRSSGAGTWAVGSIASGDLPSLSGTYVDLSSSQVIAGTKTFSSTISGSISGNAATATTATTAATATNALALGGNAAASYNTTAQNDTRYLQLTGGTLTGALSGTSASFSGNGSFTGSLMEAGGSVLPATGTATSAASFNSNAGDLVASAFNSGTSVAQNQTFRWLNEATGNNSASPGGKLNLLYSGTSNNFTPTETGISIAPNGQLTFAAGQTFPGSVTSVTAANTTITIGGTAGAPTVAVGSINAGNIASGQVVKSLNGMTDSIVIGGSNGLSAVNGSGTITVTSNATSADTANTMVARDGSGNFSANTLSLDSSLALPSTSSGSIGVITLGGTSFLHGFGSHDTFVGSGAGNFTMTSPAHANTGVGFGALAGLTTGGANIAIGEQALPSLTTGNSNIAIGQNAGNQLTASETNDIYIGNQGTTGESNTVRLGSGQTQAFIAGTINGNGSGLTSLNAGNITSGTLGIANGGTGITTSPAAAGQFLRSSGAGTWAVGSIASGDLPSLSGTYVDLSSSQVIAGTKTFSSTISGSISGNAATATTATNASELGGIAAASYNTTTQNDARYLQLSGGTLTGALSGTSASFSGNGTFTGSLTEAGGSVLPSTGTATAAPGGGFNSNSSDLVASAFNSSASAAQNQLFRWQTEPVGNNTSSPSGTLNLLFSGTSNSFTPTETGLSVAASGLITFAGGQTFPGTGTVTSVGTGAGLTGGPVTGSGTISIATTGVTNAMLQNPSLTVTAGTGLSGGGAVALGSSVTLNNAGVLSVAAGDSSITVGGTGAAPTVALNTTTTDARYLQLTGGSLIGSLSGTSATFTGSVTATGSGKFNGDGSGLTGLNAANLTGSIADARLSPNVALFSAATPTFTNGVTAASFTGDGSALTNLNASHLTAGSVSGTLLPGAGGDLGGTLTNASVNALRGTAVSAVAPATGQLLKFDGAAWAPAAPPTVSVNSTPVSNPNLTDSSSVQWTANGSTVTATPHADCVQTVIQGGDTIGSGTTHFATNCTIPANTLKVGSVIELWASGSITSDPSSGFGFDVGAKLDATTPLIFTTDQKEFEAAAQPTKGWLLEGRLVCTVAGAPGTIEADGTETGGSGPVATALTNGATVAYDTTASHTIDIYETNSSIPAGASFTMRQLIVKVLP